MVRPPPRPAEVTGGSIVSGDTGVLRRSYDTKNVDRQNADGHGSVKDGNSGNNYTITFCRTRPGDHGRGLTMTAATNTKGYDGTTAPRRRR